MSYVCWVKRCSLRELGRSSSMFRLPCQDLHCWLGAGKCSSFDQTVWMFRLVWVFTVHVWQKSGFRMSLSVCFLIHMKIWNNFNLYYSLGLFSRWQINDSFLIFPRKLELTFHANSLQWRQFTWNVKSSFLGKMRKVFQNVTCKRFYPEC